MFQKDVRLSDHSTIGLGGPARYFCFARTQAEIILALRQAREDNLGVQIIGGGSNVIFSDAGFDGLVLKVGLTGLTFRDEPSGTTAVAAAGVVWDDFVAASIAHSCTGIECLSGIPGLVGGTPIQNVGAYGQEVSDTIFSVRALDRKTFIPADFSGPDCRFAYRKSRFKGEDAGRYVITEVTFRMSRGVTPVVRYAELEQFLHTSAGEPSHNPAAISPRDIRTAVLALRRKKSMVLDPGDPNTRSAGSFFVNPVITENNFIGLTDQWTRTGGAGPVPHFSAPDGVKVPAAWLVEQAGFPRGFRRGGAGISAHHSLAIVNFGGTTDEILGLAAEIEQAVRNKFGITLQREAVIVPRTLSASS